MHWRSEKRHPLLVDSRVVEGIDEGFDGLDRNPAEFDWWESRKLALRDCVALLSAQLKAAVGWGAGAPVHRRCGSWNAPPETAEVRIL